MSKMKFLYSLRFKHVVYGIGVTVFLFTLAGGAYASDSQVVIVTGTANHCLPYPSCYKPYEIDVQPGTTVTWVNNDSKTHTATAGTPNYGSVGWVNGSLSVTSQVHNDNQKLVMTKQIENTGGIDANSVIFRLRILNDSGFLFYDNTTSGNVPARQNTTVKFTWNNPPPGSYRLNFNSENLPGQTNENNIVSSDLISVSKPSTSQPESVMAKNFTLDDKNTTVPEFGPLSFVVLAVLMFSVLVISVRSRLFKV